MGINFWRLLVGAATLNSLYPAALSRLKKAKTTVS